MNWNKTEANLPLQGFPAGLGFALVALYLMVLYGYRLPATHFFMDSSGVRDMGTILGNHLAHNQPPVFLLLAIFGHMEGPFQWLFLNLYQMAVGDLLPLNPATVYFPQVVFAFLGALYGYLLGKRLVGPKLGWVVALALILTPWMGISVRRASLFMTMSVATQSAALYYFLRFMDEPGRRLFKVAAPLALLLYMSTGLDWPSFLPVLGLFVLLSGGAPAILRNPFMLAPLGFLVFEAGLTAVMYFKDMPWHTTVVAYPWHRFLSRVRPMDVGGLLVVRQVNQSFGAAFWVALVGLAWYLARLLRPASRPTTTQSMRLTSAFWAAVCVWLGLGMWPFLLSGVSEVTYAYVLGLPVALMCGLALLKWRWWGLVPVFVLLAFWQWNTVVGDRNFVWGEDDLRVPAMAAYLNEKRPDLLASNSTTSLLPRNNSGLDAACVGQYARGRNRQLVMAQNFPATGNSRRISSPGEAQRAFVDAYEREGKIRAHWLILATEDVEPGGDNLAADFYRRLLADPKINWEVCLQDQRGRRMWLGEVKPGGLGAEQAPVLEVAPWAQLYRQRYDRFSFLMKNAHFVYHY